jgi:hypothetical protein
MFENVLSYREHARARFEVEVEEIEAFPVKQNSRTIKKELLLSNLLHNAETCTLTSNKSRLALAHNFKHQV